MNPFSLIDEEWIPVVRADGSTGSVGLREALVDATHVKDLACANPLEHVAILRLLLAICYRAIPILRPNQPMERYTGAWPAEELRSYLDGNRGRFNLFDDVAPFLQAPWLRHHPKVGTYPVAKIVFDWASGAEKTLLDHHYDNRVAALPAPAAARALVAHQQFATGGLSKVFKTSSKGAPGTGFAHCWVVGQTLARTLAMAQFPLPSSIAKLDLPTWEQPLPTEEDITATPPYPAGAAHLFSWPSRSVLLLPEPDGSVSSVRWAEGLEFTPVEQLADPMESRRPGVNGPVSFHFSDARSTWRGLHAMTADTGKPAATLLHAASVTRAAGEPRVARVRVAGLLTDKAKLVLWRQEDFVLPLDIATDAQRSATVTQMIKLAEDCGRSLRFAVRQLAHHRLGLTKAKPSPDAVKQLAASLPGEFQFWADLEPLFAREMLELGGDVEPAIVGAHWRGCCRTALVRAWEASVHALGSRGTSLAAAGAANKDFLAAVSICKDEEAVA